MRSNALDRISHKLSRAGQSLMSRFGFVSRDEASQIFNATFMRRYVDAIERGRSISGFAGGRTSVARGDFMPAAIGPNAAMDQYGDLLCRRVRSLIDSNPFIDGAMGTFQNEVLGQGIVVQPDTGDDDLNKRIEDAWHEFAEAVDVDRSMSIYESQRLALAEFWGGGECFMHYAVTDSHRGRPEGWAVRVIERERLPLADGWMLRGVADRDSQGNTRRQSLELDRLGRVVAYHVLDSDPNDNWWAYQDARPIPASQIEHMFRRRRSAQLRGLPIPLTSTLVAEDHDAFVEACVYLSRMIAAMGLVVKTDKRASVAKVGEEITELDGTPVGITRPGFIWKIGREDDVKHIASTTPAPAVEQMSRVFLRAMAAGMGVSYSRLARDFSQSNYSSTRQEELGDRRGYGTIQWLLYGKHDYPLYRRWLQWQLTVGSLTNLDVRKVGARLFNANPLMPGWSSIDPVKDATADQLDLDMGVVSPQTVAASRGRDFRVELRKRIEAEVEEDKIRKQLGASPRAPRVPTALPPDVPNESDQDETDLDPKDTQQ